MKYVPLMMMAFASVVVSGCAKITADSYCDVAAPILFGSDATVDYLMGKDQPFLIDVIVHNETHERLCP